MTNEELQQRIIETADEYHVVAEEQWKSASELEPVDDETSFEFRRLVRAALQFYLRAYLQLSMVETDAEQDLETLIEITGDLEPAFAELVEKNQVHEVLDEDSTSTLSQLFSTAEALRAVLLDRSNKLAASLPARFAASKDEEDVES